MLQAYTREFGYNLRLASPVIMGMLGHTFVALIDNVMVGQLGTAELAAVSLGNSFMFIAMSLGIGFSTAITPLVAAADAASNFKEGKSAYQHGLFLCASLGILLCAGLWWAKPLLYQMQQPKAVVTLAIPYLHWVLVSLIPLVIFQGLKQFADGLSMTRYPMYATLFANSVNILINYLLIFGAWGFPQMGIIGAAIGTLVSRIIMVNFLWILLRLKPKSRSYVSKIKFFVLDHKMLQKILSLGFPSALQMFFEVVLFTAAIWLSGILGKNPQAANQIALNLSSMTFMVAMGLGVTAMIRVGNQKGLRQFQELRRIAFSIFAMALLFATVFATVFVLFHEILPKIYLDEKKISTLADTSQVIHIAAQLLLIAAWFQISDALQVVVLGALRGLQDVRIPTLLTFVAYWVIGFPISYYLGLHTAYQSKGIWFGLLAGLTVSSSLLFLRFNYLSKKMIANQKSVPQRKRHHLGK